jgi:L-iditol 2-dehydrogenase
MGLLLARLANVIGCHRVFGTDFHRHRLDAAAAGGIHALDAAADWLDTLRTLTDGRGADVVIVTPGSAAAVEAGLAAAAPGARVVCFTPLPPGTRVDLEATSLYFREVELVQSYSCGPDETRQALGLLADGVLEVADLITHRAGLDGVGAALQRAHAADGLKTVILPHAPAGLQERGGAS